MECARSTRSTRPERTVLSGLTLGGDALYWTTHGASPRNITLTPP
jgi:hypothetical protein